jgi:NADH-quinone oxidoreductase subunit I
VIGIGKGMVTTLKHLLRPAITVQYPLVKRELPERSRMSFTLPLDENGTPLCKSCLLCAKACPDNAITIESEKREGVPGRTLTKFSIDLGVCMYCGMCIENCPSDGLHQTGDFENASPWREDMALVLFEGESTVATTGGEDE